MAPRATWRGFLKIGEVICGVGLHAAASTSQRVAFHTVNRETGHRVRRRFVDSETGKPVEKEDQVKGYETAPDQYIVLEPDEIESAVPKSDKTMEVKGFVACSDIDTVYLDRPYYLSPSDGSAAETFALIRDSMREKDVAALAGALLFRRYRTVLVRPYEDGLVATTLNFDYEVRSAAEAFSEVPDLKIEGEMLDLAEHIIGTKKGSFAPESFEDRYDAALAELVKAKMEGREIKPAKPAREEKVVDLMAALRESAKAAGKGSAPAAKEKKTTAKSRGKTATKAAPRRKAG